MIWAKLGRRLVKTDSLFVRIAGLLVLNLLIVQIVTVVVYRVEADHLPMLQRNLPEQITTTVRMLDALPADEREAAAAAVSTPALTVSVRHRQHFGMRFFRPDGDGPRGDGPRGDGPDMGPGPGQGPDALGPESTDPNAFIDRFRARIAEQLASIDMHPRIVVRPQFSRDGQPTDDPESRPTVIGIALSDGMWVDFRVPHVDLAFRWVRVISFVLATSLVVSLLSLWFARRLSGNLAQFARAAEELGRSSAAPPLAETGPQELRLARRAFNQMQERLRRFVTDRTQMLAAISHDLRTPLTRMRLRAEFVDDEEQRDKMLRDIAEMEAMIAATLAFARDEAMREPQQEQDLDELLDQVCENLRESGADVIYQCIGAVDIRCSPSALRRALSNLIENAVKYGNRARVQIRHASDTILVDIDDDGPGIPVPDQEAVFQPFFRLERSRNRDTGGVGLGLSVARTILRSHGGDVMMTNRPEGGLRVTAILPL